MNENRKVILFIKALLNGLRQVNDFLDDILVRDATPELPSLKKIYKQVFEGPVVAEYVYFRLSRVQKSTVALGAYPMTEGNSSNCLVLRLKENEIEVYDEAYDRKLSYILDLFVSLFSTIDNIALLGNKKRFVKYQRIVEELVVLIDAFVTDCEQKGRPLLEAGEVLCISSYLDEMLFGEQDAIYQRKADFVTSNLDNDNTRNRIYLGTYFPRSYSESFQIFSDLFHERIIEEELLKKEELRILVVGSGTGGDLMGLLHALLHRNLLKDKRMYVDSFEGNAEAIEMQKQFVERFNREFFTDVVVKAHQTVFVFGEKMFDSLNRGVRYDVILTFKFINEFYRNAPAVKDVYRLFVRQSSEIVAPRGVVVIGEVTDKANGRFLPMWIADELRGEVAEGKLGFLLPKSCALWGDHCDGGCFSGKQFCTKHGGTESDASKLTFRILATKAFCESIVAHYPADIHYMINYNLGIKPCCYKGRLQHYNEASKDAFSIKR